VADVRSLERLLWFLPLLIVPLAFATLYLPGAKTWVGLARVNVAAAICLAVCAGRIVSGFGAPGSGPKGQDVGFILIVSLGLVFSALANSICGAMILRGQKPAIAEWFRVHSFVGPTLTALASVPVLVAEVVAGGVVVALVAMVITLFKR